MVKLATGVLYAVNVKEAVVLQPLISLMVPDTVYVPSLGKHLENDAVVNDVPAKFHCVLVREVDVKGVKVTTGQNGKQASRFGVMSAP